MVTIKASIIDPIKLFTVNGLEYPKGVYIVKYTDQFSGEDNTNTRVSIISKYDINNVLVPYTEVTQFTDGTTPYSDLGVLQGDLADLLGFNYGGLSSLSTGWGNYLDTQYTSGAPFAILANTDTALPNNAGTSIETQKPLDVTTFYDGTVITGRNGDNLDVQIYFYAVPTSVSQWIDIWIDITGGTGLPANLSNLYRQTFTFPKSTGVERGILYALPSAYTLDTWQANGGVVKVRSNAALDIYGINYNLDRSHKAR